MKCKLGPRSGEGGGADEDAYAEAQSESGRSRTPSSGVVNAVPSELFPTAPLRCSRAKRLGVIVAPLSLLVLPLEQPVRRRSLIVGIALSIGVDTEADSVEEDGSGEERAVWKVSEKKEEAGVWYVDVVVLMEETLLSLFADLERERAWFRDLGPVASVGGTRGLISMEGDFCTCITGVLTGMVFAFGGGGGSSRGISSVRNR